MRILQVFNQYRFRGGEEAWVDIIPELLGDSATVEDLRYYSEEWVGSNKPSLLKQAIRIGDNPASRVALRDKVRVFRPDALLFHNIIPVGSLGLYDEARKLGIPVLQYTHNFRPFSPGGTLWDGKKVTNAAMHGNLWPEIRSGAWQGSRIKTTILAWHLKRAIKQGLLGHIDHWLAISEFMREQFILAGIPSGKISTLRHCHSLMPAPQPAEQSHYLFMGRLVAEKGVYALIQAWEQLEKKLGEACPMLVIAGDGPLKSFIHAAAMANPHVKYVGFVTGDTKDMLIKQSKAVMVPSIWWEPLGLTVYDAYSHGRPVIASKSGALLEIVINKKTGWSYDANDSLNMTQSVIEAEKAGPDGRDQAGLHGHEWLHSHASPIVWRNRFISLCQKVIEQKKIQSMKKVLTYGTFDLLHRGHINLLKRAKELGDHLTVGLSTNEFNAIKGKQCFYSYEERKMVLEAIRYVDEVIVEDDWQQKRNDIKSLDIATLVMGDDWRGKFDDLSELCNVVYLPRTDGISTTMLKGRLSISGDNVDLSTD